MDMTVILGVFTLFFFVTLFIMCYYRSKINFKFWNAVFIIVDLIAMSCWTYSFYDRGYLGDGWRTLDNISPMMFTLMVLTPFLSEKIKEYAYSAFAFLNVGMFLAMLISPEHDYIFNFRTEATFAATSEAIGHMVCSLYGIFLVLTKKVKADFNHWVKSIVFLLSIISFAVTLNFIYHRSYFGMDPYGVAQIYMFDLFGSFHATLAAYYFGVVLVLTVGMQGAALLDSITMKFFVHETNKETDFPFDDSKKGEGVIVIDPEQPLDLEEIAISVNLSNEMLIEQTVEDSSYASPSIEIQNNYSDND